jgi:acyl-CoA reductase-like NAD-dependent aldehyde dehydrogenase
MPLALNDWKQIDPTSQASPSTIPSAATIAPTTFLTILTGNTAVVNITPPVPHTHMLAVQFAGVAGTTAAGNVLTVVTSVANVAVLFLYNPNTGKYTAVQ